MITTSEIAPSPALHPFVRCYRYREFDTKGHDVTRPWHASEENILTFHFKAFPVGWINPNTNQLSMPGTYGGVVGTGTQYNGEIILNGSFSFLEIIFKPNGFYNIFKIPSKQICDSIIYAEDIFNSQVKIFYEQLASAKDLKEMGMIINAYLLNYLCKKKFWSIEDSITSMANLILQKKGMVTVDGLAYKANMSKRNFERKFMEQIGVSPKLLCCITRFNHALVIKFNKPDQSWLSVAHQSGYFDQMHLIKDFKRFTGTTPSIFLEQTPLSKQTYLSRVEE